jgi:hypothetical protein
METVREKWTDERLDDLNGRVGELSRRTDDGFSEMRASFNRIDARLDRMQQLIVQAAIAMAAATLTAFVGLAGLILTQV